MNIGTLAVTCDHIERVSPTGVNDNRLTILLDDVNADLLMRQVVAMLDPEELLAYFEDSDIVEYFNSRKAVKLSPREQHSKLTAEPLFIASEGIAKQTLSKWDAKLDENKCYEKEL
jgi:hypothetical protein